MKVKFVIYLVITFLIFSCTKENALDCFKSNGSEKTETRYLDGFNKITAYDKIEYTIVQGNEYKIEITAGSHIISSIKTTVNNNVLTIRDKNKCNFVRGYKKQIRAKITVPYIYYFENYGVGNVHFDSNFSLDSLFIRSESPGDIYVNGNYNTLTASSHGDGNIYAAGNCNALFVYMNGTNSFNGENEIIANYAYITNISLGNAFVKAPNNGTFECDILSDGNIYYSGNPSYINNKSSGNAKGQLIKN